MVEVKKDSIVLPNLSNFPSNPQEGQIVVVNRKLYKFVNGNWIEIGGNAILGNGSSGIRLANKKWKPGEILTAQDLNDTFSFVNTKKFFVFSFDENRFPYIDLYLKIGNYFEVFNYSAELQHGHSVCSGYHIDCYSCDYDCVEIAGGNYVGLSNVTAIPKRIRVGLELVDMNDKMTFPQGSILLTSATYDILSQNFTFYNKDKFVFVDVNNVGTQGGSTEHKHGIPAVSLAQYSNTLYTCYNSSSSSVENKYGYVRLISYKYTGDYDPSLDPVPVGKMILTTSTNIPSNYEIVSKKGLLYITNTDLGVEEGSETHVHSIALYGKKKCEYSGDTKFVKSDSNSYSASHMPPYEKFLLIKRIE